MNYGEWTVDDFKERPENITLTLDSMHCNEDESLLRTSTFCPLLPYNRHLKYRVGDYVFIEGMPCHIKLDNESQFDTAHLRPWPKMRLQRSIAFAPQAFVPGDALFTRTKDPNVLVTKDGHTLYIDEKMWPELAYVRSMGKIRFTGTYDNLCVVGGELIFK
jgi:hypothetical protein